MEGLIWCFRGEEHPGLCSEPPGNDLSLNLGQCLATSWCSVVSGMPRKRRRRPCLVERRRGRDQRERRRERAAVHDHGARFDPRDRDQNVRGAGRGERKPLPCLEALPRRHERRRPSWCANQERAVTASAVTALALPQQYGLAQLRIEWCGRDDALAELAKIERDIDLAQGIGARSSEAPLRRCRTQPAAQERRFLQALTPTGRDRQTRPGSGMRVAPIPSGWNQSCRSADPTCLHIPSIVTALGLAASPRHPERSLFPPTHRRYSSPLSA